jgi:thioredoxin 1
VSTIELSEATFESTVADSGIVLVDWWASWCGPCRMFAPVFEDAASTHTDIVFAKVNTEAEQNLAAMAGIRSIPTLMAFRDGVLLFNQAGALPAHMLEELIGKIREVDMDAVRASIAAEQAMSAPEGATS